MTISFSVRLLLFVFTLGILSASGHIFTFKNSCTYGVWPGILSGNMAAMGDGGFELAPSTSLSFDAPSGWSGRFWGRTGCDFDGSGTGKCITGDCGGLLKCTASGEPPATLVEITMAGSNGNDFYDVSVVDGYNVGMSVKALGGYGKCQPASCVMDLNGICPAELQVRDTGSVVACKSACMAFTTPMFCCTGSYGNPQTCKLTHYSAIFKSVCPTAYSYAYDDASSLRTCSGTDYMITFCPTES